MTTDSGSLSGPTPVRDPGTSGEPALFRNLTIVSGLLAALTALAGILLARSGIILFGSANNRMIAFSAALIWIFLGSVLAYQAARPLKRFAGLVVQAILALIAVTGAIEFVFSVQGGHFLSEHFFVNAGTLVYGSLSTPVSPAALALAVPAAVMLLFLVRTGGSPSGHGRIADAAGISGLAIVIASFTFALSYAYGDPLLYGSQIIPIAFISALAAVFTGAALVGAAGPGAVPARYMTGNSMTARLFRAFVPLVIGFSLVENFVMHGFSQWFHIRDAVLSSAVIVISAFITALVVARVSGSLGGALDRAEKELVRKNEDLGAMNEELTAMQEELRQTNDDLVAHEQRLVEKNKELSRLNAELGSAQNDLQMNLHELTRRERQLSEALAEKEILLSEIHHRVKNNLTAFISLLSLDGSTMETPEGREIRKDLQNRARSMALIHETLYRTHKFDRVDMGAYLSTLVDQVVSSYNSRQSVKTIVDIPGITLDLARATPAA